MPTKNTRRGHDLLVDLNLIADPRVTAARAARQPEYATSECPASGEPLAAVRLSDRDEYDAAVERAAAVQKHWRMCPAPKRGEILRLIAQTLRDHREQLGELVALEMGKIKAEGVGEVQEAVDIADFCVGLSRQLYGLTMHSERPQHRMYEQWHPLGTIGVITAFNFPVAVWSWNAMVAATCGNAMIWKPSLTTPLVSIALNNLVRNVMSEQDIFQPQDGEAADVFTLVLGMDEVVGEAMIHDRRLPLISATGSCRMGRHVGQAVASRLGKCLLELGGNNAMIVTANADLELATRAALFGAVGTAGQRCTTTRRLICHKAIVDELTGRLVEAYGQVTVGDPLVDETLMGPLISADAVERMKEAINTAAQQGGEVLCGGIEGIERLAGKPGHFVEPTIIRVPVGADLPIAREETFAPILYVFAYESLDEAVDMHNNVDQGLSSAIFTDSLREAERFLSHAGSDCGIANVNIGTSGAEIGGAFGGEKDTGGGRESGSDAWKNYMRRQTCTINWGDDLPLAQGITFGR